MDTDIALLLETLSSGTHFTYPFSKNGFAKSHYSQSHFQARQVILPSPGLNFGYWPTSACLSLVSATSHRQQ
jgi:hypothetical protein